MSKTIVEFQSSEAVLKILPIDPITNKKAILAYGTEDGPIPHVGTIFDYEKYKLIVTDVKKSNDDKIIAFIDFLDQT